MSGSVKRDKSGGWYYVLDLPRGDDAKRKQKKQRGFGTRAEAEKALRRFLNEMDEGRHGGLEVLTVGEFLLEQWLPRVRTSVKETTLASYERDIRLHIAPHLGHVPLAALTAAEVSDFYARLCEPGADRRSKAPKGLSPKTIHNVHLTLHKAFEDGLAWKRLAYNPCVGARKPRQEDPDIEVLDWQQFQDFLEFWRQDRDGPVVEFILRTGLRRAEALGLRWQDVHPDKGRIFISHTHPVVNGKVLCDTPKTESSKRWVPLTSRAAELLEEVRKEQAERHLRLGKGTPVYVFTREDGEVYHPDLFTQRFGQRVDSGNWTGPRITVHGLRHTFATLSLTRIGMHIGALSRILGHKSVAFTMNKYTKWMPDNLDEAIAGWNVPEMIPTHGCAQARDLQHPQGWSGITDVAIHTAIDGAVSLRQVVQRLGLSVAAKNYDRLRAEADRLGMSLPEVASGRRRLA